MNRFRVRSLSSLKAVCAALLLAAVLATMSADATVGSQSATPPDLAAAQRADGPTMHSSPYSGTVDADSAEPGDYVPGQVVVKLTRSKRLSRINERFGTTIIEPLSSALNIWLLTVPEGEDPAEIAVRLAEHRKVIWAYPNLVTEPPVADPKDDFGWRIVSGPGEYLDQAALGALGMAPAGTENAHAHDLARGEGIAVYVLDTGLYSEHPQLDGVLPKKAWKLMFDHVDEDNQPDDDFIGLDLDFDGHVDDAAGHGTFVSGLIHLIAPDAWIVPIRVLDPEGYGNEFIIAEAITGAVDRGVDVINLSFSSPQLSPLMHDALQYASSNDVLVVAAGGNNSATNVRYPGASSCVLGVAALDNDLRKPEWATFGDWIDVAAPGVEVVSTFADPNGSDQTVENYVSWSGASASAGFVSGQAALVWSMRPDLSAREVAAVIARTARSVDEVNEDFAGGLGSGIPDVYRSLDRLTGGYIPALVDGELDPLGDCH